MSASVLTLFVNKNKQIIMPDEIGNNNKKVLIQKKYKDLLSSEKTKKLGQFAFKVETCSSKDLALKNSYKHKALRALAPIVSAIVGFFAMIVDGVLGAIMGVLAPFCLIVNILKPEKNAGYDDRLISCIITLAAFVIVCGAVGGMSYALFIMIATNPSFFMGLGFLVIIGSVLAFGPFVYGIVYGVLNGLKTGYNAGKDTYYKMNAEAYLKYNEERLKALQKDNGKDFYRIKSWWERTKGVGISFDDKHEKITKQMGDESVCENQVCFNLILHQIAMTCQKLVANNTTKNN